MKIKGGYGYYDITNFSIGGCFRRAPAEGLNVIYIKTYKTRYLGVDMEGIANDRRIAFDSGNIDNSEILVIK